MRNDICEDCGRSLEDGEYCGCDDYPYDNDDFDDWDDDEGNVYDDEY